MQLFIVGLFLLCFVSIAQAAGELKQEGECSGHLEDGSTVSFAYYSNYEGCLEEVAGSIKFSSRTGLSSRTGRRTFENKKDIYTFKLLRKVPKQEVFRLAFEDSTGNTSGVLDYFDMQGTRQSASILCTVTDYEYEACP
jgi:hypothetical protein